ncbi:MAG: hypothetical protein PHF86_11515 [Candidatus Nanoarchaeia archaeon]|nr:hypothetical protein [Candidatus Nanoarchaeia archaeon]
MALEPIVYNYDRFKHRFMKLNFKKKLYFSRQESLYFSFSEEGKGKPMEEIHSAFIRGLKDGNFVLNPFNAKSIDEQSKIEYDILLPTRYVDSLDVIC